MKRLRPVRNVLLLWLILSFSASVNALPVKPNIKIEASKFLANREIIERKLALILDFSNITEKPQWLSLDKKSAVKSAPIKLVLQITAKFGDDSTARKLSEIITSKELESAGIQEFTVKNTNSGLALSVSAKNSSMPVKVTAEDLKASAEAFLRSYSSHNSLEDGSAANITSLLERRLLSKTFAQEELSKRVNRLATICLGSKKFNSLNGEPEILKSILVSLGVDVQPKQPSNNIPIPSIRALSSTESERSMTPSPISPNFSTFPGPQTSFSSVGGGQVVPPIVSGQSQKKSTAVSIPRPRSVHWTQSDVNAVSTMVTPSIPKNVPNTEENAERRVQYPKELDQISRKLAWTEYMERFERLIRRECKQLSERPPAGYRSKISFKVRQGHLFELNSKFGTDWGEQVIFRAAPFHTFPEGAPETVEFSCLFTGDQLTEIKTDYENTDLSKVKFGAGGDISNPKKSAKQEQKSSDSIPPASGNGEFLPYVGNLHTPAPSRRATVQVKSLTVDNFMKEIQDLITENRKFRAIDIPDDAPFATATFDINRARVINNIRISKSSGDLIFDKLCENCIKTISVPSFPTNSPDVLKIEFKFGCRESKGDVKEVEQKPLQNSADVNATSIELRRYSLSIVEKLYPWILLFLEDAGLSSRANISFSIRNGQIGDFKIEELMPNDTADNKVSYYLQKGIEEYWPSNFFAVRKLNAIGSIRISRTADDAFAEVKLSNTNHILSSHKYFVGKIKPSTIKL